MKGKIFALRGKGNSGKSTAIRISHNILVENDFQILRTDFNEVGGDFLSIYQFANILVGVTSSGDTHDLVHRQLRKMVHAQCQICVCACRTSDRKRNSEGKSFGTNSAVRSFEGYEYEFIEKTVDDTKATQMATNARDADRLFELVKERLKTIQ